MTDVHSTDNHSTRRNFLRKAATATVTALTVSSILPSSGCSDTMKGSSRQAPKGLIGRHNVILFQGDSITDAGRDRASEKNANNPRAMGNGYVFIAASQLLAEHSDANLSIYNRGISGNKVFQLADRWDKDCIVLKPDVVSILIGVNDIWHTLNGSYKGTIEIYERDYRALMDRTRRELPGVKLVICEPFVLRCGAVNDKWFPEFDHYRATAKKIAADFNAIFVPFQSMFDAAVKNSPPNYWAADGVHPSMAGCHLMAQAWLKTVSKARA